MKNRPLNIRIVIVALTLILCQLARIGLAKLLFHFMEHGRILYHASNTVVMTLLTILIMILARKKGIALSVFPSDLSKKEKACYIAATFIAALFLSSCLYFDRSVLAVYLLIHGSVVVPIFEESLFRGLAWNYLKEPGTNEWIVFAVVTLLFGVWHLGYVDSVALRVEAERLAFIMLMKVLTGIFVGIFAGLARKRTGNAWLSILFHSVWNGFAR